MCVLVFVSVFVFVYVFVSASLSVSVARYVLLLHESVLMPVLYWLGGALRRVTRLATRRARTPSSAAHHGDRWAAADQPSRSRRAPVKMRCMGVKIGSGLSAQHREV